MLERSGSVWTALAHSITAVIGSGVLSLAWSMSRLGWIAGPLTMLAFASVTLTSAFLLCNCFHCPDLNGEMHRNGSYLDAVGSILGKKNAWICGIVVRINFIKLENGEIKGSTGGVPSSTTAKKVWTISQALGDIAFAFPFSVIFLEIMDTLKSNPSEKVTMRRASIMAVFTTTFFYFCCGGFGYAAFGNSTPGNLLTGFGFYEPYWLIDFANACVVLHLVGGYQVFSQPLYASIEKVFANKYPNSRFVQREWKQLAVLRLNL